MNVEMDQNFPENPEKIVCRYYLKARCYLGNDCPVSHIRSPDCIPDDLCRFYLKGRCHIGENCHFKHAKLPIFFKVLRQEQKQALQLMPALYNCDENNMSQTTAAPENTISNSEYSNWVNAPEFIPKMKKTYAETLQGDKDEVKLKSKTVCYFPIDYCPYGDQCPYVHGDLCDICECVYLHPYDEDQRIDHKEKCMKELEDDMDYSFAVQRSIDKTCGICMDVILDKDFASDRRFGILENCSHVFCLNCIRKWRSAKKYENRQHSEGVLDPFVTRACPECRRPSDFVTPSPFWFENEDEKKKLIEDYKQNLGRKHCRYFRRGEGICNFGSTCFYLHANPDGTIVKLPAPTRRKRQNQRMQQEYFEENTMWDFLRTREENILIHLDVDEFLYNMTLPEDEFPNDVLEDTNLESE